MIRVLRFTLPAIVAALGMSVALHAKPATRSFRDCRDCPQMVPVPAGSFQMGMSAEAEIKAGMPKPQAGKSEPIHTVTFAKGFAMAAAPITVAQFRTFVDATGYRAADSCTSQHKVDGHFIYETAPGLSWQAPGFSQGDNYPVVCVSAEDGEAYAAWLSKLTGHNYALPNEAQYEYAARAGTTSAYFWGSEERDARACEYSNQPDLDQAAALKAPAGPEYRFQCHDGFAWTSPVGRYKPNPWGLYDMQGNIWEWTADCWNDTYNGAPADGTTWTTGDCDARSSRGGSYGNAAFSSYVAIRAPRHATYVGHSWGFRVVRTD